MADEQLVNEIVRLVLERLKGAPAPQAPAAPAAVPAPKSLAAALAQRPAAFPSPNAVTAAPNALKRRVFLTADDLRQRIDPEHKAVLFAGERLTPNAQDYVDQHGIRVERLAGTVAAPAAPSAEGQGVLPAAETFGVVLDRPGAAVASALAALGRDGMGLTRYDQSDCWMRNSSAMLKCIAAGTLGGGVLLAPTGSAPAAFANKFRGIRAVLGLCTDGVAEAVDGFDANVLIVEHGRRGFYEIRTLIARFIERRRRPRKATAMLEALRQLEQC